MGHTQAERDLAAYLDFGAGGPIAVIADVHGNRWALEAVLEDIERRGIHAVLNLGDTLFGPLDPGGTAELFRRVDALSVRGNQDRILLGGSESSDRSPTYRFVLDRLTPQDLDWLRGHEPGPVAIGPLIACHGTIDHDDRYLIEQVTDRAVALKEAAMLAKELSAVVAEVVLCAHSHVPRTVSLPDLRWVMNPGSVGLPAYTDDFPYPHAMEAGSPHARYGCLERTEEGWRIEHVALPYDWEAAAFAAEAQARLDWATWLRSGRASA